MDFENLAMQINPLLYDSRPVTRPSIYLYSLSDMALRLTNPANEPIAIL